MPQPKRSSWNTRERELVSQAIRICGSRNKFATKSVDLGNELGVRVPASVNAAGMTIGNVMQKRMTEDWAKELFILTAETVIDEHEKRDTGGKPPPPPPVIAEASNAQSTEADLRRALQETAIERDKYRNQALDHQQKERVLQEANEKLEHRIEVAIYEVEQIKIEAIDLLKDLVMSKNGKIEGLQVRAAQLVLRQEKAEAK